MEISCRARRAELSKGFHRCLFATEGVVDSSELSRHARSIASYRQPTLVKLEKLLFAKIWWVFRQCGGLHHFASLYESNHLVEDEDEKHESFDLTNLCAAVV